MINIITNYDSVKSKNFNLNDKQNSSEKYRTFKVNYNNENFYLQTPYINNRYSPSRYDSKISLDIPLDISNIDGEFSTLYKLFNRIHKTLKNRVIKNLGDEIDFSNCIKKNKNTKCSFLKTKIHNVDDNMFLKVFNSDKTLSTNQEIKPGKEIRFILHLESIWIFKKTFGINWFIVQAEIKLPHIFHSYIFDNNKDSIEIISKNQDYQKYFKMVSVGVPKEVVKIKMVQDGLNSEIIEMDPQTTTKIALKEIVHSKPLINLILNDLKNIKLKKPKVIENKKIEQVRDNRIPSKEQLLDTINGLKKTESKII
jgi:hypothetical protein